MYTCVWKYVTRTFISVWVWTENFAYTTVNINPVLFVSHSPNEIEMCLAFFSTKIESSCPHKRHTVSLHHVNDWIKTYEMLRGVSHSNNDNDNNNNGSHGDWMVEDMVSSFSLVTTLKSFYPHFRYCFKMYSVAVFFSCYRCFFFFIE